MKGLFIKDLRLLKGQKSFFAAVVIMMTFFMMTYRNYSFVISYVTIMFGILTLTTMSYDEFENGMGYLLVLPISRKQYVIEKYLFSILSTVTGLLAVSGCAAVISGIRNIDFLWEDWVSSVIGSFMIVTIMLAVMIPLQMKFGAEKSRVAMMLVFGGGALIVYMGMKLSEALEIDWTGMIEWLESLKTAAVFGGFFVICGLVMVISCQYSMHVIKKREF